jgi:hypothetical protein
MRDKTRHNLAPAEAGLRLSLIAACMLAAPPALAQVTISGAAPAATATTAPVGPTLSQTLDAFHPTAKQTIALRDFLGARGDKVVPLGAQADGLTYFDLRDATNQRTGQIAVGADTTEGSIFIARLSGPAIFDASHRATMPRVQSAKMRGAIGAALAASEAGPPYEAVTAKSRDMFLRDRPMLALTPQPVTFPERVIEMEASFFSDGSGFFRLIRAPVGVTNPVLAEVHTSAKFYPAIQGDGQRAYRAPVIGIDADFNATLADFGDRASCPVAGCTASQPTAPITLKGEVHSTRWPHAVVPSAPANLIAQISPPPPLPDILQNNPPPQNAPGGVDGVPHT